MPRTILGTLFVVSALLLVANGAQAAHAKHQAHVQHKKSAAAAKPKHAPSPSLAIVSKTPTDAPDFDYSDRIDQAQTLATREPVLPNDMQIGPDGRLAHFTW